MNSYRALLVVVLTMAIAFSVAGYTASPPALADAGVASAPAPKDKVYSRYMKIADDADTLSLMVPAEWTEVETGPWVYAGQQDGVFITASPNLDNFYQSRKEPGVFIAASHELSHLYTAEALLALEQRGYGRKCKHEGRTDYQDLFYAGRYDSYITCTGGGHKVLVVAATPVDQSVLILIRINVASNADVAAAARILETFQVLGTVGEDGHDH